MYLELKDVQVPKKAEKRVGLDPEKESFSGKGVLGFPRLPSQGNAQQEHSASPLWCSRLLNDAEMPLQNWTLC